MLRLNSLPQFRFVTSQLTLLQRFVALHAVRRQYLPSVDSKSSFDTKRHPISFGLAGTCRVTCIRLQCSLCLHVKQVTGSCEDSGILCLQTVDCYSRVAESMEDENFVPAYARPIAYSRIAYRFRAAYSVFAYCISHLRGP